jgi:tetratricopeptide (TPR) repeat protein
MAANVLPIVANFTVLWLVGVEALVRPLISPPKQLEFWNPPKFTHVHSQSRRRPAASPRFGLRLSSSEESIPFDELPASKQERRNEHVRRIQRKEDVVIGKTSALPNANDYVVDPAETERDWYSQASDVETEINILTEKGLAALKLFQLEEANEHFSRVYDLRPNAYLWQAGVVKYYRGELEAASECFARNALTFESKFMSPASEERIWRDACELKAGTRRERTKKTESGKKHDLRIAKAPSPNPDSVPKETRKILRIVRELFQGSVNDDVSAVALNRAKLRSICGDYQSNPGPDRKKWKLSSWYYLGLHHDAIGEIYSSKACMKMALRQGGLASGNGSDFINVLPMLHMTIRDWFDDDLYEEDIYSPAGVVDSDDKPLVCVKDSDEKSKGLHSAKKGRGSDASNASAPQATEEGTQQSAARAAIQASLENVNLASLREALRKRGMKTSGSKAALQQRLLHALLEDIGL